MKKFLSTIVALSMICSLSAAAFAASETWDGSENTGTWATVANWVEGGVVPGAGNTATFNSAGGTVDLIDLGVGVGVSSILFTTANCADYTIGSAAGQTLTLWNAWNLIEVQLGVVATETIAANVVLLDTGIFSNDGANDAFLLNFTGTTITGPGGVGTHLYLKGTDTGNNTISSAIVNGAAALAVDKEEAGTWILSGANTYTGVTTFSGGTLSVATIGNGGVASGNLGSATNAAANLVFNGGTLQYTGVTASTDRNFTLNAATTGTIQVDGGAGVVLTMSGSTAGVTTGALTKTGTGTLTLTGTLANTGITTITAGTLQIGAGLAAGSVGAGNITNNATLAFNRSDDVGMANIISGTGALTKAGAGVLTLSGANTYTGATTVNAGTLTAGVATVAGVSGAFGVGSAVDLTAAGTLNLVTFNNTIGSLTGLAGSAVTLGTATLTAGDATSTTFAGVISGGVGGALTKEGAGTLTLSGANTYTGATAINTGVLNIRNNTATGTAAGGVTVANLAALQMQGDIAVGAEALTLNGTGVGATGALRNISGANSFGGAVTLGSATRVNSDAGTLTLTGGIGGATQNLTVGGAGNTSITGVIGTTTGTLTKDGAGTLTLSGANTYTGATAINAGTVVASNANALGNGSAVTVANGTTLDVGTTNVTVNAVYTQQAGSTLKVTIASTSSSGKITSNANAVVSATSNVNVTVPDSIYIPTNTTFTIIDGAGGAGVNVPGTIASSNSRLTFSGLSLNGDLILTALRSGTGFSSLATNSNTSAVGAVLDNISNPSSDMTTVLNTLEGLSNSQTESALETVIPIVDSGVTSASNTAINQFIGTTTQRMEEMYAQARNEEETGNTGVSTGSDELRGIDVWGQGFGEYAHQDHRGLSNGYHATIWGIAMGGDIPVFNDRVRLGLSGGYAQSDINSKDNSGNTDIDSYQGTLYGGYIDGANPYYLNGAFSFAYNKYKGSRHIAVGTITRTANADYDGQQYSVLVDGGYTFKAGDFRMTPIASLQYLRLHLEGYTESGAGALNLSVKSQNYDMLQSGLGMKLERPFNLEESTLIPEVHARWLYDFIGDKQETTSTFSGGGGSFATQGFDPALNALDLGAKLTLLTKDNWSLETNYDFEYKEDFTAHTGWADIRYRF